MTTRSNGWLASSAALAAALVLAVLTACAEPAPAPQASKAPVVPAAKSAVQMDAGSKSYKRTAGVSGNLNSVGSDTLNNLMTLWAEGFRRNYPNVRVQIEGKGSSTAPPALIEGAAQLGPMSRKMKSSERDKVETRYGYPPTRIRVALDALAVYLHRDNPIGFLTIPQVDAIYSKARRCGEPEDIVTWGQLGLKDAWANKRINPYGRNSASGTYGYFKKHALCKGDYKDTVKEQPGSASVVQGVTEDLYGIGYSGIGYRTSGVKAIALSKSADAPVAGPSMDNVVSQKYPLSRYLYIYIVKDPNRDLDPLVREFIRYVLSGEGQKVVIKDGYLPLSADVVDEELQKLQ